ncbi:MAG: hypothetical protein J0M19_08360 [Sphingomonadales bacterium]|nr:hypothetical protein [Sphingomonadales bacterium]
MTQLTLSPRTLRVMRFVRIAAWAGIAVCVAIQLFQLETGLAGAPARPVFQTGVGTSACVCTSQPESLSPPAMRSIEN